MHASAVWLVTLADAEDFQLMNPCMEVSCISYDFMYTETSETSPSTMLNNISVLLCMHRSRSRIPVVGIRHSIINKNGNHSWQNGKLVRPAGVSLTLTGAITCVAHIEPLLLLHRLANGLTTQRD